MARVSVPTKQDFDWLRAEMVGFIRTQLIAAAATLRLAEQLQNGGRRAEDFAAAAGLEPAIAFRFLWALASSIARASKSPRTVPDSRASHEGCTPALVVAP